MIIAHDDGYDQSSPQHRMLEEDGGMSAPVMIAWYCLVVFTVIPTVGCIGYCWCSRYSSYRRAQRALNRELDIEREQQILSQMEANIQAFSEAEKARRKKIMRAMIRKQTMEVEESDIRMARRQERKMYGDESSLRSFCSSTHSRREFRLFGGSSSAANVSTSQQGRRNGSFRRNQSTISDDLDTIEDNGQSNSDSDGNDTSSHSRYSQSTTTHSACAEKEGPGRNRLSASALNNGDSSTATGSTRSEKDTAIRLKASSCSICLEAFTAGDTVAHAWDDSCPHVFHEDCIVMWLITQQQPLCPCCRQHFTQFGDSGKASKMMGPAPQAATSSSASHGRIPPQVNAREGMQVNAASATAAAVLVVPPPPPPPRPPRATGLASVVITIPPRQPPQPRNEQASSTHSRSMRHTNLIRTVAGGAAELDSERTETETLYACSSRWDGEHHDQDDIVDDIYVQDLDNDNLPDHHQPENLTEMVVLEEADDIIEEEDDRVSNDGHGNENSSPQEDVSDPATDDDSTYYG
eukprot:CAMPEP_0119561444 /NCGR_PEP_ID=MMETSP1352-20130426/17646_1 /TAXON_ID=265584 /ORGANISM="Stauroneis constricta, Strain CCMP1120" /LENGTH=521 /DNA_ID=CAMNT_0007609653 /DNA_START=633 /DNA_END=2198 /DNA_ORIENTATION=+